MVFVDYDAAGTVAPRGVLSMALADHERLATLPAAYQLWVSRAQSFRDCSLVLAANHSYIK